MREIASYIADQPQKTFPSYYKSIECLQNLIFNNSPEEAFNALTNIESIHFELSNNSVVKDFSKYDDVSDEQPTLNCTAPVDTTIVESSNVAMESAAQVQQNDSCKECGFVDPPKKRTKTIPWIQCDHCNSWYHSSCSGLNKKFKLSEQFMCKQCA